MLTFTKDDIDTFKPETFRFEDVCKKHLTVKSTQMFRDQVDMALMLASLTSPQSIIEMLIVVNLSVGLEIGYSLGQKEALRLMEEGK